MSCTLIGGSLRSLPRALHRQSCCEPILPSQQHPGCLRNATGSGSGRTCSPSICERGDMTSTPLSFECSGRRERRAAMSEENRERIRMRGEVKSEAMS